MSFSGGNIEIDVIARDGVSTTLRAMDGAISAFTGNVERALYRLSNLTAAVGPLAAVGATFGLMASQAAKVEQNVANLNAALRATPQQLAAIRSTGLTLSQQTQFTDAQILQGQRSLAKAGTPATTLANPDFNRNITDLASATFADPTQAADAYIAATKTFRRGTEDAKATVDILAQAVDSSVGNLGDFQTAFKQIGPVANAAGESLKETATVIADLQNAGLRGDTGTGIKTFLTRIEAPTRQAKAAIDDLGLSFYTAGGQLKSYGEIADEIRLKTTGLTDEQRNQSLTQIFGTRGVRVADIFAEEGGQGIRDTAQHMADIGSASEIAREKLDTLQGSAHKLGSSINVLAVQGGQGFIPMLRTATDTATGFANVLSTMNARTSNLGSQGIFGGLAIGAEVFGARQFGKFVQKTRDESPAGKAAAQAAKDQASAQEALQRAEAQRIAAEQKSYETNLAQQTAAQDRAIATQEQFLLKEQQSWEAARVKIEQIEVEHQAKMLAIQTEGAARLAALPATTLSTSARASATTAIQAETDAALAKQEAALRAATARAQSRTLAGPTLPPPPVPAITATPPTVPTNALAPSVIAGSALANQQIAADAQIVVRQLPANRVAAIRQQATTAIAAVGSGLGEILLPLTIAITAEQLIIKPGIDALINHAVNERMKSTEIKVALGAVTLAPDSDQQLVQQYVDKQTAIVDQANTRVRQLQDRTSGHGGFRLGGIFADETDYREIDKQKQVAANAQVQRDQYQQQLRNAPGTVEGEQTTRLQELNQAVESGRITADDAAKSWQSITQRVDDYASSVVPLAQVLLNAGDDQGRVNDYLKAGINLLRQTEAANRDAAVAQADLTRAQEKQANGLRDIGVPESAIQQSVYKKGTAQEESDAKAIVSYYQDVKKAQEEAEKSADEFNKRLADARAQQSAKITSLVESNRQAMGSAASGIDLSKGVSSLADAADELQKVQENLRLLGQSNPQLDSLSALAGRFKEIADAEDAATTAYRGYLLALDETDKRTQLVDQTQQRLKAGANDALKRINQGTATEADRQLYAQFPALSKMLERQGGALGSTSSQQLLDVLKNFPNEVALNDQVQGAIRTLGPQTLVLAVKEGKNEIRDYLRQVERDGITVAVHAYAAPQPGATGLPNPLMPNGGVSPYDEPTRNPLAGNANGGGIYGTNTGTRPMAGFGGGGQNQYQYELGGPGDRGADSTPLYYPTGEVYGTQGYGRTYVGPWAYNYYTDTAKKGYTTEDYIDARAGLPQVGPPYDIHMMEYDAQRRRDEAGLTDMWGGEVPQGDGDGSVHYNPDAQLDTSQVIDKRTGAPVQFDPNVPLDPSQVNDKRKKPLGGGYGGGAGGDIQWGDYQKVLSQYPGSPIADQGSLSTLNQVAAQMGVDPRDLMAIMQTESGYGSNAGLIGKQFNYGGMGVNDRGYGFDSGVHATDGGPEYEGYKDFKSFLMDISAWVQQNGSSFSTYQTADQGQAKNATMAQLQAALPLSGGGTTAGGTVDSAANGLRQQIVQKALAEVGVDELVGYCEKFVEDTVQAITGKRGATGKNEESATTALQDARSMGLVTKDPQPGDLVYYDIGGAGHVAIYMGGGQQVSTWDQGAATGTNRQIHVEPVGKNPTYVRVPGLPDVVGQDQQQPPSGMPPGWGTPSYYRNNGAAGLSPDSRASLGLTGVSSSLGGAFTGMDAKDVASAVQFMQSMTPVFTKFRQIGVANNRYGGDTTQLLPEEQSLAGKQGMLDAANATVLWGKALSDIRAKNGGIAQDMDAITQKIGGPLAQNLNAQLTAMNEISQATDRINQLTERRNAMQRSIADTSYQRQTDDFNRQVAQTRQQWADQDADQMTAQKRRDEDYNRQKQQLKTEYTNQLGLTGLQNTLTDTQKRQQENLYGRSSQEQALAGQVKAAPTNVAARDLAAQLSLMHEGDTLQRDKDTRAIDALQLQIRDEQRLIDLTNYNQRVADLDLQNRRAVDDEGTRLYRQSRERVQQEDLWGIERERAAEDRKNQLALDALDAEIAANQKIIDGDNEILKGAQDNLQTWLQVRDTIGAAADTLLSAVSSVSDAAQTAIRQANDAAQRSSQATYDQQTRGLSTANGVPLSQFPAPNQGRPAYAHGSAGMVSGWGIVGDDASGRPTGYEEAVYGNFRVYSHADTVRMGIIGAAPRYAGGSGPQASNNYLVVPLQVNGAVDEDAAIRRVEPLLRKAIRAQNQRVRARQAATGAARSL